MGIYFIINQIVNRIDYMNDNYEGCDWCIGCGGGDAEMYDAREDLFYALGHLGPYPQPHWLN